MKINIGVEVLNKDCCDCPRFEVYDNQVIVDSLAEHRVIHNYLCCYLDLCRQIKNQMQKEVDGNDK